MATRVQSYASELYDMPGVYFDITYVQHIDVTYVQETRHGIR